LSDLQSPDFEKLSGAARDHLWLHFTRLSSYQNAEIPLIVRGDGCYIWDSAGREVGSPAIATPAKIKLISTGFITHGSKPQRGVGM